MASFFGPETKPVPSPTPASKSSSSFFGEDAVPVDATESSPSTFFGEDAAPVDATKSMEDVVKELAEKHDVEPEVLESFGRGIGSFELAEGPLQSAVAAVGRVGDAAFSGLPGKLVSKLYGFSEPKYERAFDELRSRFEEQKSTAEKAAEIGVGLLAPAGVVGAAGRLLPTAKVAAGALGGALSGGLAGFGQSERGDEVDAIVTGMGIGAVAGGTLGAVGKALTKSTKEVIERELPNIEEGALRILDKEAPRINAVTDTLKTEPVSAFKSPEKFMKEVSPERRADLAARMVNEEEVELALQNPRLKEYLEIFQVESGDVRESATQLIAFNKVQSELKGLQRRVKVKDLDALDKVVKREGADDLINNYHQMKQLDAASRFISEEGIQRVTSADSVDSWFRKLLDFKMVADVTDEKLGLGLAPALDELSLATRQAAKMVSVSRKRLKKTGLNKRLNKLDADGRMKLYQAVEDPKKAGEVDGETLRLLREQFEWLGDTVEGVGRLKLKRKTNYIPHMLVDFPEYVLRMKKKSSELLSKAGVSDWKDADIRRPEMKEFVKAVELAYGGGNKIKSGADLGKALEQVLKPASRNVMNSKAQSLFERQEALPTFLLETDVRKLLDKYTTKTFRHLYLRSHLRKLQDLSDLASQSKDMTAAKEIQNLRLDLLGIRENTPASLGRNINTWLAVKARENADQADNAVSRWMWESAEIAPDLLGAMANNIYANALGLNARAFVRNLSQPMVMTAPELAGSSPRAHLLMQGLAFKHSAGVWKDIALGRSISKDLLEEGFISDKFIDAGREYLNRGIKDTWNVPAQALNKASDWAMTLYTASDIINRQVTRRMARDLANMYKAGDAQAVSILQRLPKSYKTRLRRNPEDVDKIVANYLMSNTQFNYDRANMSEFGRVMGKMFSVFTKWPTAVAGDVYKKVQTGQIDNALIKYLGPLLTFYMADSMTPEKVKKQGRYQKLVGPGGFTSWAPALSVNSLVTGDIMAPPLWQTASEFRRGVQQASPDSLYRTLNKAAQSFMPGAGYVRFMTDDLPSFIENRRPRGPFFRRAERGVKKAGRAVDKFMEKQK